MKTKEMQTEALSRAKGNMSMANYVPILKGFIEKGIPEDEILPRENVFTFNAWKALGRVVKKGEKGVKVVTFIRTEKEGKPQQYPRVTTVFHISQTEELS